MTTMTLEQVRDAIYNCDRADVTRGLMDKWADAIDTHLAKGAQSFDWDAAWALIRSFGYTTKGQTDEICDALEAMLSQRGEEES